MVPYQGRPHWSFGGHGRKPANVGIHAKTRTMEVRASLHWSRHIASTATTSCLQYCLSDTASTASSFVIDLFNANTDLQRLFLNGGIQCARPDPFSDDNTIFSTRIQAILCILASGRTLAVMLSHPISSLSFGRNHRPLRSASIISKIPFCLAKPLGSYSWKLCALQILINKCVNLDTN